MQIKPAPIPEQEKMIELAEGLLKDIKAGHLIAFAVVGVGTGDGYYEYAITPKGTRVSMIGSLELLKSRICANLMTEHDKSTT